LVTFLQGWSQLMERRDRSELKLAERKNQRAPLCLRGLRPVRVVTLMP